MTQTSSPILCAAAWMLFAPVALTAQTTTLDTTNFVVVGEGLAAGFADFALREVYQEKSFPAQMARQMKTIFPQPVFESPGVAGVVPGFATLPARLPGTLQGSVRTRFPPPLFVFNLSVPGMKVAESVSRRPAPPVVHPRDPQQTIINMVLGYPALILGRDKPFWTQTEYAVKMNPTLVIVELGYFDVLDAAANDDPARLPTVDAFRRDFSGLLTQIRNAPGRPEMIVMTIPDPFDTAFFTTVPEATRFIGTPADEIAKIFRVNQDDYLTPNGMILTGGLILTDGVDPLLNPLFPGLGPFFPGTVVKAATAQAVRSRVTALNTEVNTAARAVGATVYDLNALFARVKRQGLTVGSKTLTAGYLGGFYSLNGYYPGTAAHGVIANDLLQLLNTTYKTSFPVLDLASIAAADPVGRFTPALAKPPAEEARQ